MKLEQTADGSYTLYVPELDEHYHSVKGALTESQHIFIDMGLKHSTVQAPRILEIGLGTGLNCISRSFNAWSPSQRRAHILIFQPKLQPVPLSPRSSRERIQAFTKSGVSSGVIRLPGWSP